MGLVSDENGDPLGGLRVCLATNFAECEAGAWKENAPVFDRSDMGIMAPACFQTSHWNRSSGTGFVSSIFEYRKL